MSKVDTWIPFHVAEYVADTMRFTAEQHGCYLLLILDYWRSGPPPDDDEVLAQIVKLAPVKWRKLRPVLAAKFQVTDGVWKHKRIEKEIAKAQVLQQASSEKGKKGAAARWHKDNSGNASGNGTGINQAMPDGMPGDAPLPSSLPTSLPESLPEPDSSPQPEPKKRAQAPFVLPDWIPSEHWNAWIEARTKAKKPPTDYAKRLAVMKLENLKEQGYPPAQVLMDAAFNNWSGLFPPKEVR